MGTKMAPSYANIFMGKLEKELLQSSIEKPLSWYRFIDDVDMKWIHTDEGLQNFITRANNIHPSIKFTYEISKSRISFLDTSSSLSANGELSTDLYSKPTDTNQYLLPSSCHPPHVTKSIPYSQALRLRRICSTDDSFKRRLGKLKGHLRRRGYRNNNIKKNFQKAQQTSRSTLLQYKEKKKCNRVPCVLTYHPCLKNTISTIREHWKSIEKNPRLSRIFPEPPWLRLNNPTVSAAYWYEQRLQSPALPLAEVSLVVTNAANVANIWNPCLHLTAKSQINSTKYSLLLTAKARMSFTFLSAPSVAYNMSASPNSHSTND